MIFWGRRLTVLDHPTDQYSESKKAHILIDFFSGIISNHFSLWDGGFVADVHPDHHADGIHEPQRHRVPGHALHPQGLRHHLPPGAERAEAQTQPEGRGAGGHRVQHQGEGENQRRQDGARPVAVRHAGRRLPVTQPFLSCSPPLPPPLALNPHLSPFSFQTQNF